MSYETFTIVDIVDNLYETLYTNISFYMGISYYMDILCYYHLYYTHFTLHLTPPSTGQIFSGGSLLYNKLSIILDVLVWSQILVHLTGLEQPSDLHGPLPLLSLSFLNLRLLLIGK